MVVSYLKKNAKNSQSIPMVQRFDYGLVFFIEADKIDLKTAAHCRTSYTQATRTP